MRAVGDIAAAVVESTLLRMILRKLGARPDVRLFRNQVGGAWHGSVVRQQGRTVTLANARPVRVGLAVGSSDLVGWATVTITPEMVGRRVAVFTAIEVKTPNVTATAEQETFIARVQEAGGIAGVARSPEDAAELLRSGPSQPTLGGI